MGVVIICSFFFFFKHKTAYEMRISDWSSDVCSSDLRSLSFGRQSPHYGFLEPKIQRRRDVSAGNGGFARKLADWAPRGVDLHIPDAWAAAQRRIDGRLQARLSRSEERRVGKEGVRTCRTRVSPCL